MPTSPLLLVQPDAHQTKHGFRLLAQTSTGQPTVQNVSHCICHRSTVQTPETFTTYNWPSISCKSHSDFLWWVQSTYRHKDRQTNKQQRKYIMLHSGCVHKLYRKLSSYIQTPHNRLHHVYVNKIQIHFRWGVFNLHSCCSKEINQLLNFCLLQ